MFDFHMHSRVSFDADHSPEEMARAALTAGLKEICFTDHKDYELAGPRTEITYDLQTYNQAYDGFSLPGISIKNGVEIGMTPWNMEDVHRDLSLRHYDFVLGSVHYVDDQDIYLPEYWVGKTVKQVEQRYFEEILACVRQHDDFDVLGHLTYASKARANPAPRILPLGEYRDIVEEIMKTLIAKGKGIEVNTSGVDRIGDYLPGREYLQLFKDLGGEIVTTGSDAHGPDRVGQCIGEATQMLKEIFGHVCTFDDRRPVFHKL